MPKLRRGLKPKNKIISFIRKVIIGVASESDDVTCGIKLQIYITSIHFRRMRNNCRLPVYAGGLLIEGVCL